MSRKSPTEFSELFKRSPTPKSPAELDQRILDYARRNTPQPARRQQPLFLTAAATLSVACIGLLVVLRSGDLPPPETRAQRAPPIPPTANRQSMPAVSDSASERRSKEMSAIIAQAEPEREAGKQRPANAERTAADASSDLAIAQSPAKEQARVQAFSTLHNQALSVPDASAPARSGKIALDDSLGMTAPQGVAQAAMEEALHAGDKKSLASATRVKFKAGSDSLVRNEDMQESLREIKKLYSDGKKNEAEKAYRELREHCGECELPASLTQALKDLEDGLKK